MQQIHSQAQLAVQLALQVHTSSPYGLCRAQLDPSLVLYLVQYHMLYKCHDHDIASLLSKNQYVHYICCMIAPERYQACQKTAIGCPRCRTQAWGYTQHMRL